MSTLSTRARQIAYGSMILAIFAVIAWYSPKLERRRERYDLGEAVVGRVDAGGFMLKLAMIGGARGFVANVQWMHAQELQKLQEWDRLKATVDFITKLQPHFLSVWTFQGWNLAYNVSVEWDDPADKYVWIKGGINFLREGVGRNPRSPDLSWDAAWTYYHKLGFADEAIILRRLFRDDDDEPFKTDPVDGRVYNDNFQVAHGWFTDSVRKADEFERLATDIEAPVEVVDRVENRKGRPGDLAFRTMPAHAQTRYADSLEKRSMVGVDAQFGEKARNEWQKAEQEWLAFGRHEFRSHNAHRVQGRLVAQPINIIDILDTSWYDRQREDTEYWRDLINRYEGTDFEEVTPLEARVLADNKLDLTRRWANQNNFPYFVDRCRAEAEPDGVAARRLFYEGYLAYLNADFPEAADKYREGLELWEQVLGRHPAFRNDELNQRDITQLVYRYQQALRQAGLEVPEEMPFAELVPGSDFELQRDPFDALDMLGPTGGDAL